MKTIVKKETTLILNNEEAIWLKQMIQNPIGCTYEDEEDFDRKKREIFWNALKDVDLVRKNN